MAEGGTAERGASLGFDGGGPRPGLGFDGPGEGGPGQASDLTEGGPGAPGWNGNIARSALGAAPQARNFLTLDVSNAYLKEN